MSFKQKNVTVTLVNFSLILGFYLIRVVQLVQNQNFDEASVFRLWGVVIVFAVFVTIAATILTHIVSAVVEAVRTGEKDPKVEDFEDERDGLIDLKGSKIAYTFSSLGACLAMLTFVFGQPPLVMFALLIFFGVLAQIVGDALRLVLYQRGL